MPNLKLQTGACAISITGYDAKSGIIRSGRHLKRHDGLAESTIASTHWSAMSPI
jgi:hypothetical protein